METNKIVKEYKEKGYVIVKSFFDQKSIDKINDKIDRKLKPKAFVPYSNSVRGYGNLLDVKDINFILSDKRIQNFLNFVFGNKDYTFNHLMVHNKPPWVGIGHEWHQESANINSFAPGQNWKNHWQDFVQIFVPLDSHTIKNGCLKLIPKSFELGLLEHTDIVDQHYGHKRRITEKALTYAAKKYKIIECELEPGDLLLFNHLIAHGSSNNNSEKRRRVIVAQARKDKFFKNKDVLSKEINYRIDFAIKCMKQRLEKLSKKREKHYNEVTKYTLKSIEIDEN